MMLPNQITSQKFSQNGKGGYKAVEVEAFLQRVYQSFNKLYVDNKALCEKLDSLMPMIDEYNNRKNTIADALIWAKSTAEKNIEEAKEIAADIVANANEEADRIVSESRIKADAYYTEKTTAADEKAEKARAEYENLKRQTEIYSDRYIAEINVKTRTIIEDANTKAASIVSEAYSDAKKAREKADRIIEKANNELDALKAEAAKIKNEILNLISYANTASESISDSVFDHMKAVDTSGDEVISANLIDADEIEVFSLDGIDVSAVHDDNEFEEIIDESEVEAEVKEPEKSEKPSQPDYVRFFGADLPDVDDLLADIFTAVKEEKARMENSDEDNSFRFMNFLKEDQ